MKLKYFDFCLKKTVEWFYTGSKHTRWNNSFQSKSVKVKLSLKWFVDNIFGFAKNQSHWTVNTKFSSFSSPPLDLVRLGGERFVLILFSISALGTLILSPILFRIESKYRLAIPKVSILRVSKQCYRFIGFDARKYRHRVFIFVLWAIISTIGFDVLIF